MLVGSADQAQKKKKKRVMEYVIDQYSTKRAICMHTFLSFCRYILLHYLTLTTNSDD